MDLTPREKDKLLLFTAGLLAERRKARGLKLNVPESIALISCSHPRRRTRRQDRGPADERRQAGAVARRRDGRRAEIVTEIQVEATFPDGTKLVTVHQPIALHEGAWHQ
jgi:urease subunit gamma